MKPYEYENGRCTICGCTGKVRHKSTIWLIGSEGTDMCWPCEMDMLNFLREKQREFTTKKLKEIKELKRNRFLELGKLKSNI